MNATTVLSPHLSEEVRTKTLIKIGGYCALVVAALQITGNALHPPIPPDTIEALGIIQRNQLWNPVHIGIAISYFLFIPFVLGAAATFNERTPLVRIATPLVIVGAAIGSVQILSHLTVFRTLAMHHATGGETAGGTTTFLYELLWPYSVALEIAHLLLIFAAAILFGVAMLRSSYYPRWIAIVGMCAGVVATAGILVGKFVVTTGAGDLIFGVSLLPLIVWIVAVGIVMLRARPVAA